MEKGRGREREKERVHKSITQVQTANGVANCLLNRDEQTVLLQLPIISYHHSH